MWCVCVCVFFCVCFYVHTWQGGWLHGDVSTEDALQTLHASMLRQESAQNSQKYSLQ